MKTTILTLMCALLMPTSTAFSTLVVGRVDNFEGGTIQRWSSSAGHDNISSGGPAGADDNYLQIHRPTNSAPYPFHLGTKNTTTWTGDYLSAGIKAIAMDVNTISITTGPANLSLRIVLFGPGGAFSSKEPATVITEGGWQHVEFGLTRSDLVRILGDGSDYIGPGLGVDDLTATLSEVGTFLIRHDPASSPTPVGQHPEHIMATLGIDNITAVLGSAPTYDVAWTFGNVGNEFYTLDRFEPSDIVFGDIDAENPTLLLHLGRRYQITVADPIGHPFELVAKHISPELDDVLLSAVPDQTGPFEGDPDVEWFDNESGTVAFTLTGRLYDALTVRGKRPGYRCGLHTSSMRGDIDICTVPITSDLSVECNVVHDYKRTGWKARLSTLAHGVSGVVEILDADTLLIESFNYDGGGSEVSLYLAPENTDASLLTGLPIGSLPTGNIYVDDTLIVDLRRDLQ
ncbi:MAG: DM13 domain-containing protein [Phycisphaerae bacterium]|nr:DM13 domain-containing protein [Phycisphaerae bacterium]